MDCSKAYYQSPIGWIEIEGHEKGITSICFTENPGGEGFIPECIKECKAQLEEYFKGRRKVFDLKLAPQGTAFQKKVWEQLTRIPYGSTISYLELAAAAGIPGAARAAGGAVGKNLLWIVLPCHRVIGKDGGLTGFAGGLPRKEWLLRHEGLKVEKGKIIQL